MQLPQGGGTIFRGCPDHLKVLAIFAAALAAALLQNGTIQPPIIIQYANITPAWRLLVAEMAGVHWMRHLDDAAAAAAAAVDSSLAGS